MNRREGGRGGGAVPVLTPGDTLLRGLVLMERARTRLLPVVCAGGMLVGLVTEAHLLAAWKRGPLEAVWEVMTPIAAMEGEAPLLPTG